MTKPDTRNTLMVSILRDGHLKTFILPLCTIHTEDRGDIMRLVMDHKDTAGNFTDGPFERMYVAVTDDPYAEWAGDWSHLGCFRLQFILMDGTMAGTTAQCSKEHFKQDLVMPDRRMFGEYDFELERIKVVQDAILAPIMGGMK
jgi:hypothetical protein